MGGEVNISIWLGWRKEYAVRRSCRQSENVPDLGTTRGRDLTEKATHSSKITGVLLYQSVEIQHDSSASKKGACT